MPGHCVSGILWDPDRSGNRLFMELRLTGAGICQLDLSCELLFQLGDPGQLGLELSLYPDRGCG